VTATTTLTLMSLSILSLLILVFTQAVQQLHARRERDRLRRENEALREAFNEAINFALETDEGLSFLREWMYGGDLKDWPEFKRHG